MAAPSIPLFKPKASEPPLTPLFLSHPYPTSQQTPNFLPKNEIISPPPHVYPITWSSPPSSHTEPATAASSLASRPPPFPRVFSHQSIHSCLITCKPSYVAPPPRTCSGSPFPLVLCGPVSCDHSGPGVTLLQPHGAGSLLDMPDTLPPLLTAAASAWNALPP